MARIYLNTDCKLHGTKYCAALNMVNCDVCTVRDKAAKEVDSIMHDIDVMESFVPPDGVADLFARGDCALCTGEEKGERKYFALADLGHAEPKSREAGFLGIKRATRAGSILPLQIASCKKCRRNFLLVEYLPTGIALVLAGGSLLALSIRSLRESLMAISPMLPFLAFVLAVLVGLLAGMLLRGGLAKRFEKQTHMKIFEIPKLKEMLLNGWFPLNEGKQYTKLIFSRKRLKQGIYTGNSMGMPHADDDATAE